MVIKLHNNANFNENPSIIIWETTKSSHSFHTKQEDDQLSFQESVNLIDQIYELNKPQLIFSGEDCIERPDLFELAQYGLKKGLQIKISPEVTRKLSKQRLQEAEKTGLTSWEFNLDGPTPEIHDYFRRAPGSFELTIKGIHNLNRLGMRHQINTAVTRYNYEMLEEIAKLVAELKATTWSVFTFVPTNRNQIEDCITAAEHEKLFKWLYQLEKAAPYNIKTNAAQHYYRVAFQQQVAENLIDKNSLTLWQKTEENSQSERNNLMFSNVNDGNGYAFISSVGDVFPSPLLPIKAGNIKQTSLKEIYRSSEIFQQLRNPDLFKGKCGKCEYRYLCGGSRSRAYAVTGDYLASEPFCVYVPEAIKNEMKGNS